MTTTAPAPTRPGPSGSAPVSPGLGDLWRRARGPLAFLGGLVAFAVVLSLGAEETNDGLLDPEGTNPEGTRALAQIVEERGAEVTIARGTGDAVDAAEDNDNTVMVVAQSHRLLPEELDRLAETPGDLLLVQPTTRALDTLAPGVRVADRSGEAGAPLSPDCGLPAAQAAGVAETGGELYTTHGDGRGDGADPVTCYPSGDGAALVQLPRDNGVTTVIGTGVPMTNERLASRGNAALTLNVLDGRDTVWFLPDVPTQAEQAELWDLVPRAFYLALAPLGVTLLLLALWRGRRLGPLVAERLPVVVRASETTEGRARLYAARRTRGRAATALRTGVLERVRPAMGLAAEAPPESVVAAIKARTGDDPTQLSALLYGNREGEAGDDAGVPDDAALVRLADDLDALEERLR